MGEESRQTGGEEVGGRGQECRVMLADREYHWSFGRERERKH